MRAMIRIFSGKNNRIKMEEILLFLNFYEEKYLFFAEISEYEERKKELLQRKSVDCMQFTGWLKENYPKDVYSKCYLKRRGNIKFCSYRTMYGGIGYIHIWVFDEEIIPAIKKLTNMKTDYLIIDLRDNCGGSVDVLINSFSYFLKGKGTIEIQDRNSYKSYNVVGDAGSYRKIFLLVNKNTMSCAEILMMVLYENMKNVYIVGGPTFMKDKGQITMRGGKVVLSITNFNWYVSGKKIKDFWKQPGERVFEINKNLSEQDMVKFVYSQLGYISEY